MSKKSTLILLSVIHICILGICILTIYNNKHSKVTVAHVSSDTKVVITQDHPDTMAELETVIETAKATEIETETEVETKIEIETETEPESTEPESETQILTQTETDTLYSFRFIGTKKNLNIRNAPCIDAKIIGKIPVGGCGNVLELTNENWMLAEYNGIVGYCSRDWIELQEITE